MTPPLETLRRTTLAALAAIAALCTAMPGCGGSGGVDSGGTGIATTLAMGPISGFGSVVVAGVHYDESSARLIDGDDQPIGPAALTLGAGVSIDAGDVARVGTRLQATAQTVRVDELVIGPVEAIDLPKQTLRVLGQPIVVTAGTAFDSRLAGGLTLLSAGTVVAVHGQLDSAGGRGVATRIELRPGAPAFLVRGTVAGYDRTARRLAIGSLAVSVADLGAVPDSLPLGARVRVKLGTAPVGGVWPATALRTEGQVLPDRNQVEVDGRVTAYTSPSSFIVDGLRVDASTAVTSGGVVALGARVEVEGRSAAGVIVASRVTVDTTEGGGDAAIELEGRISAIDTTARTFVLRGQTVDYGRSPRYTGGAEADLAVNRAVNVKGRLSSDRQRIEATSIHVEL